MHSRARGSVVSVLVLVGLVCCAPPAQQAAPEPAAPVVDLAAEEQTILDSSMQWLAAEQEKDLLTTMSFMAPGVTTIFDGRLVTGRAALEAAVEARWEEYPYSSIDWTTSDLVVAASGDLAYERGSWTTDLDGAGGEPAETGEYVTVWQKSGGEWKVVVDAGSTIKPAESG